MVYRKNNRKSKHRKQRKSNILNYVCFNCKKILNIRQDFPYHQHLYCDKCRFPLSTIHYENGLRNPY